MKSSKILEEPGSNMNLPKGTVRYTLTPTTPEEMEELRDLFYEFHATPVREVTVDEKLEYIWKALGLMSSAMAFGFAVLFIIVLMNR